MHFRSRHPVSNVVHIRGLTRPFTEGQLRAEIQKNCGEIVDLWMDKVKSHCFVKVYHSISNVFFSIKLSISAKFRCGRWECYQCNEQRRLARW